MHFLSTRLAMNSPSSRLAAMPLISNRHTSGLNSALASQVRLEKRAMSQLDMHLLSPRLAMLLACGSSAMSQLDMHLLSPRLAMLLACGSSAMSQLELHFRADEG